MKVEVNNMADKKKRNKFFSVIYFFARIVKIINFVIKILNILIKQKGENHGNDIASGCSNC